ncbi:hypothetical protein ACQPZJ_30960 [Actinoplanes sp. CA-054009]
MARFLALFNGAAGETDKAARAEQGVADLDAGADGDKDLLEIFLNFAWFDPLKRANPL